ncbi:MAG: hypothetical protein O7G83_09425 [Proteobacteria bacterium]|nr:hypothetical protein [Pseudomonadota bacterium]MCZ6895698.1 hypothetical protein [Gammaproteobacteria bacterium]
MPKSKTWVVKLGGAMMRAPDLRQWLSACAEQNGEVRCVLVPGGGGFADQVRALQATWEFDDRVAHALAIEAMRMNAQVLQALLQAPCLSSDFAEIAGGTEKRYTAIWTPRPGMTIDGLPETWEVTSDSIALHVAHRIQADALLLVKSVDASLLTSGTAAQMSLQGLIDDFFPRLLARYPLPTMLVSKRQHVEFNDAVRSGQLFGARVDP